MYITVLSQRRGEQIIQNDFRLDVVPVCVLLQPVRGYHRHMDRLFCAGFPQKNVFFALKILRVGCGERICHIRVFTLTKIDRAIPAVDYYIDLNPALVLRATKCAYICNNARNTKPLLDLPNMRHA